MPSYGVWSIYLETPLPAARAWHVSPPLLPRLSVEFFACARQSFTELGTRAMISVSASPSLQGVLLGGASFSCTRCAWAALSALHCTALERRGNKRAGPAANAPNARRKKSYEVAAG